MRGKMLTEKQKELWDIYHDKGNWRPPSARMLARISGRRVAGIYKTLQELNRKGYYISLTNPK